MREAFEAAREVCQGHARSFYFASRFLPRQKRMYAYAVYAFCRRMDDAVDEGGVDGVEERLAGVRVALDRVYGGEPDGSDPVMLPFAETVRVCGIPKEYFLDLADGCRMDLLAEVRYRNWGELEGYCYHVAGVVGLIMCRVFGLQDESALGKAVKMGNAMQLTNILRDVAEDWGRGRVYLPLDEMARFGVTEQQIASGLMTDGLREFMRFQVKRARGLYVEAAEGLGALPNDGSRLTACVMAVVYSGILGAIERQGFDPFAGRARVSLWGKVARLPRAWKLSRQGGKDAGEIFG